MARHPDGETSFLSSEGSLSLPIGSLVRPDGTGGYHLDFRSKVPEAAWPPRWLRERIDQIHVETIQWALGAHERYVAGEGGQWLTAAVEAGRYLQREQETTGGFTGAWVHGAAMPHTYQLAAPWISGMAQGEGASLFVRLHAETGDDSFRDSAELALRPLSSSTAEGGVLAMTGDGVLPEEYPTDPPSHVLNGAIFALWGLYDYGRALGDDRRMGMFEDGVRVLVSSLHLYDTGYWSRYDLYPHPVANVASAAYHLLHINQLRALHRLYPDPMLNETAEHYERYRARRRNRVRAFAAKALFRCLVPRNRLLAHRLPWSGPPTAEPSSRP